MRSEINATDKGACTNPYIQKDYKNIKTLYNEDMRYRLVKTTLSGIKNIENPITLSFTKKNFDSGIIKDSHVKAIYGPNGSGKSGIVHAIALYREILLSPFGIRSSDLIHKAKTLINKKTKRFAIEHSFARIEDDKVVRYAHTLKLGFDEYENPFLESEMIVALNGRMEKTKTLYEAHAGLASYGEDTPYYSPELKYGSVVSSFGGVGPWMHFTLTPELHLALKAIRGFALLLCPVFGEHRDSIEKAIGIEASFFRTSLSSDENYFWIGEEAERPYIENMVKRLALFLKILKPTIQNLELEFHPNGRQLYANLLFHYADYRIDYRFESSGIKKAADLFLAFLAASRGYIVFIDEVDADIHDVFLASLVSFFVTYWPCQIVMTTHNVELMESVEPLRKSIDFLSIYDQKIVPWVKRGDISPKNVYLKGFVEDIPFNIHPADFSAVFGEEGNKDA